MSFLKTTSDNNLEYVDMEVHNKHLVPLVITSEPSSTIEFDVTKYDLLVFAYDVYYGYASVNFVNDSNSLEGKRIYICNKAMTDININNNQYIMGQYHNWCYKRGPSSWERYES